MNPGNPRSHLRSGSATRGPGRTLAWILVGAIACSTRSTPQLDVAIPDPDLSGMEPQVAAALKAARQAVVADVRSADRWGELGASFDAHVLFHLAEVCYAQAQLLDPDEFRWAYLHAIVREVQGAEEAEVVRGFEIARRLRPDYAPISLRLGDALWRRGEYDQAAEALARAIRQAPDAALAHRKLGQVQLALGQADAALSPLESALALRPEDRAAHLARAQALRRLGRDAEADAAVARAEEYPPNDAIDDPVYAEQVSDRGRNSGRAFNRAMGRIRAGDHERALQDLELVLAANPDNPDAHYWAGTCRQRLGQADAALGELRRALELKGTLVKARLQIAEILAATGRFVESAVELREALRLTPDDPAIHLALAEVSLRTGDLAGVVEAYASAEKRLPLPPRHRLMYGVALLRSGDVPGALRELESAVEALPDDADAQASLGQALEAAGRRAEALARLRKAASLDPAHPSAGLLERLSAAGR